MAVTGRPDGLAIATPINGALRVTGQIAAQAGNVTGAIAGLVNRGLGQSVQGITGRTLDQRADVRGNVAVTARPVLTADWRVAPNLSAAVTIGEGALSIAGIKLNIAKETKPLIDRSVAEQVAALEARVRNDPFLGQAARREWAKLCRAIPLGAQRAGLPDLWLELRPTRAIAAQPRVDAAAVTLTIGVEAETRITPAATTPQCPFPERLELVPATRSRVAIAVPIDLPFTEVSRLLDEKLKGRSFPQDGSGPLAVTVLHSEIAASGDRLLISLRVKARERASWLGLGAEADVHIWGRPTLDAATQTLRLADMMLAVESEAVFGLIGAAARAAIPYLQAAIADSATVDLKPFAASARRSIGEALAEFRQAGDGFQADASITDIRLAAIEFDARTLRVIAEAEGQLGVMVTQLKGM